MMDGSSNAAEVLVRVDGLTKSFGPIRAVDAVTFEVTRTLHLTVEEPQAMSPMGAGHGEHAGHGEAEGDHDRGHDGERAVAAAAAKFGTMLASISPLLHWIPQCTCCRKPLSTWSQH